MMAAAAHPIQHSPSIVKGSLYAILAFFFMAVFGVLTKEACQTGEFIWVSFITYSTAIILTACCILPQGIGALKSQHYLGLITRGVVGTVASFLYMYSMQYISVVNSTLLFNTAPIFIPLFAVFAFKVREPKQIWYAVVLGFMGILIIIRPNADIITNPGNLIGLLSGIALAVAYLVMKVLTATEPGLRIIFYYFGLGTLIQIPLLFLTHSHPNAHVVLYASLCGLMLMLAQLQLIKAYTYAAASEVGVYQYTTIVFVALIQWVIAGQTPDLTDLLGFILVAIAGIFIIVASPNLNRRD